MSSSTSLAVGKHSAAQLLRGTVGGLSIRTDDEATMVK